MVMETLNTHEDIFDKVTVHYPCADYLLGLDVQGDKPYGVILCDTFTYEARNFGSLDEALPWMDRQMDQRKYPRADTERRSFNPEDAKHRTAEGEARHQAWLNGEPDPYLPKRPDSKENMPRFPKGASVFHIQIMYRQHSSWQGKIVQMRRKPPREAHFRSVLELLYLIHSALPDTALFPEQESERGPKE